MLWPEGSDSVLANLGSYFSPQVENVQLNTFVISKSGSFLAVASKQIVALFRLKPLAPLWMHPSLFPNTEIIELIASNNGEFLAIRTSDNRLSVFSVEPHSNIEEALRMTTITTPGLGEAIGARELHLKPLFSIIPEYQITGMAQLGHLLILFSNNCIHLCSWESFDSSDLLNPPKFIPNEFILKQSNYGANGGVSGAYGRKKWITACCGDNGVLVSVFENMTKLEEIELTVEGTPISLDYNIRLHKLAVCTQQGKVLVFPHVLENECIKLTHQSSKNPIALQWNAAGTVLWVGYSDGWQLLSMLGMPLFNLHSKTVNNEETIGVRKCEFLVSGEAAVMLSTDGKLKMQNMLRWSGFGGSDRRPVLHGNGRLLLYHDVKITTGNTVGISNNGTHSWLTVPLPTWYMAQNWPIAHVCSSNDGRYVAVAGKVGIMLFSVLTKQWKEIGDRESMVRGGLCWHGRRLIAASVNPDNDVTSLKMYSPVDNHSTASHLSLSGSQFLSPSPKHLNTPNSNRRNSIGSPLVKSVSSSSIHTPHTHRLSAHDLLSGSNINSPNATLGSTLPSNTSISTMNTHFNKSEQQVVAEDLLGKGPCCLVSLMTMGSNDLLAVLAGDESKQLLIYELSTNDFDLIRDIPLTTVLSSKFPPDPVIRAISIVDERRIFVLVKNTLVLVSSINDEEQQFELRVIADPIETFEYHPFDRQLWVFDGQEGVVTEWKVNNEKRFVASVPLDAYPVHFSSHRGVASLIESDVVRSYDGGFTIARPTFSQDVYIQFLLEAALVTAFSTAVEIAKKYQKASYFPEILESLLYHTVVNEDDKEGTETKLAVNLIYEFPNQNALMIFAACARKVEMKYWSKLFKAVGAQPAELFDTSLRSNDLKTATEYLIVVQTYDDENAKLDLKGRILLLYNAASIYGQFWICRQLCEFIMAVDPSGDSLQEFMSYIKAA